MIFSKKKQKKLALISTDLVTSGYVTLIIYFTLLIYFYLNIKYTNSIGIYEPYEFKNDKYACKTNSNLSYTNEHLFKLVINYVKLSYPRHFLCYKTLFRHIYLNTLDTREIDLCIIKNAYRKPRISLETYLAKNIRQVKYTISYSHLTGVYRVYFDSNLLMNLYLFDDYNRDDDPNDRMLRDGILYKQFEYVMNKVKPNDYYFYKLPKYMTKNIKNYINFYHFLPVPNDLLTYFMHTYPTLWYYSNCTI
jgi:hypothetical protein